jgi:hypothetical protein
MHMLWPNDKLFAFTIIDDTDNSFVDDIKPVYDLLRECNIFTTKTVWIYPPKDKFKGLSLQDDLYLKFIDKLRTDGFEIALHGVGSGDFYRDEILKGLEEYKQKIGNYPEIHINHSRNIHNIYWNEKRFVFPFSLIMLLYYKDRESHGEESSSPFFWGDFVKDHIKYIRNLSVTYLNTLAFDPLMPYLDKSKIKFSNYWFSSSDGQTIQEFNKLLTKKNIDDLKNQRGASIVYTHFSKGFVGKNGEVDPYFEDNIRYLAQQGGWFVPAGKILDHLLMNKKEDHYPSYWYSLKLNFIWLVNRVKKYIEFKR